MKLNLYQIDAFTDKLFGGNPAAVISLKKWMPDLLMQNIALENNLSETAFILPSKNDDADYEIRWFTPAVEIDLCGHATLAAAYVLFNFLGFEKKQLRLASKSGILTVKKEREMLWLNFPLWKPERINDYPSELQQALGGVEIVGVYKKRDLLIELINEDAVRNCVPDFTLLKKIYDKVIITAPGKNSDFVSRFFAPIAGVDEDPATGSAHSQLIPFWSEKLNKQWLTGIQLSKRGAIFLCEQMGDRVKMGGNGVFYMKGKIHL